MNRTAATIPDLSTKPWTMVEGGVTRGDVSVKRLALIFTGHAISDFLQIAYKAAEEAGTG